MEQMPQQPWNRDDCRRAIPGGALGMVHLAPLPGSPGWEGDMALVRRLALTDAQALASGGFGALMVENYHDIPFYPGRVPAETVAAMTAVISALRAEFPQLPLGVNVLRNDVASALGIAVATGASFVRVNVHTGAAVTDQGSMEGRAWETLRLRRRLGAGQVAILADLRVKHARPLAERPLDEEARDLRLRGLADGVIITGAATGSGSSPEELDAVRAALPDCPLLVGSGMTAATAGDFFPAADACIVGSSLKETDPETGRPAVSAARAEIFMQALGAARREGS
jgi:membrane complex biogenesis BtpA family protein